MNWFADGILDATWWQIVLYTLAMTHITMASITIFLHRHQSHHALELHSSVTHFLRGWLWLTTGIVTKIFAAIHRKHHAKCETIYDPHSPQTRGILMVLFGGYWLYLAESKNLETIQRYGKNTVDDWLERNLYARHHRLGIFLMLIIDMTLFGVAGIVVWIVQMLWTPIMAAGVINGIGHFWGYRNFETADASTNISPWGILIAGEELHNNHHKFPGSAKLSVKPYEFDIGWMYISLLSMCGLATVKKVAKQG